MEWDADTRAFIKSMAGLINTFNYTQIMKSSPTVDRKELAKVFVAMALIEGRYFRIIKRFGLGGNFPVLALELQGYANIGAIRSFILSKEEFDWLDSDKKIGDKMVFLLTNDYGEDLAKKIVSQSRIVYAL